MLRFGFGSDLDEDVHDAGLRRPSSVAVRMVAAAGEGDVDFVLPCGQTGALAYDGGLGDE